MEGETTLRYDLLDDLDEICPDVREEEPKLCPDASPVSIIFDGYVDSIEARLRFILEVYADEFSMHRFGFSFAAPSRRAVRIVYHALVAAGTSGIGIGAPAARIPFSTAVTAMKIERGTFLFPSQADECAESISAVIHGGLKDDARKYVFRRYSAKSPIRGLKVLPTVNIRLPERYIQSD